MQTASARERLTAAERDRSSGRVRRLATDARVAYLLADHVRARTVERLFGVPKGNQFLITLVALGMLANAARDKAGQAVAVPSRPSLADTAIGAALLRESAHGIAGPSSRDEPLFGTLVAVVVVGSALRPVVRSSAHGVRTVSHRVRVELDQRLGDLLAVYRGPRLERDATADAGSATSP